MFSFFSKVSANYSKLAYDFNFNGIDGNKIELSEYRNKVIVVVNVASRCVYLSMKVCKLFIANIKLRI